MKNNNDDLSVLLGGGISLFLALLKPFYILLTTRKTIITVQEKGGLTHGYVTNGNGRTYTNFMIYAKDGRSFENVNTFWCWKWRSTELQSYLQVGKTYRATIYGWRLGAFNVYPNIVKAQEVRRKKK